MIIVNDVHLFIQDLKENPAKGISLGNNCYKARIRFRSIGKSKSGGARIITYVKKIREKVYLSKEVKEILKIC